MLLEKVAAILPHHEQLGVRVLVQQALGLFDDILVIGPRQALVRRDDQAAIGAIPGLCHVGGIEIVALHPVGRAEDTLDLYPQGLEIGAGLAQVVLGPAQLGGGDEIHGVGDLSGLLHAFDALFDLLDAGHVTHHTVPANFAWSKMPWPA